VIYPEVSGGRNEKPGRDGQSIKIQEDGCQTVSLLEPPQMRVPRCTLHSKKKGPRGGLGKERVIFESMRITPNEKRLSVIDTGLPPP